jgi:hypothetical protein
MRTLLLCALLAAAPTAAAATVLPPPWRCRPATVAHVSADGSQVRTTSGDTYEVSHRGEFRVQALNWVQGDNVRICQRVVNGYHVYSLSHGGTRVQATLLRGKF